MGKRHQQPSGDAHRKDLPAFPDGPPPWPLPDEDVRAALQAAYADGSWGRYHGPHVQQLSDELARGHGVPHSLCVASGTVAVELALRGLGIGAGDEVILAAYDFPGNFRAIEAVGARPVLIDVLAQNWCLDAQWLDQAYTAQVRAIVVSHLHGGLAPMAEICGWAAARGVGVVEDACQASGAIIQQRVAGSWGDVGVLSFGGSKLLTAGRGGALLTARADVLQRIKIYANRGNEAFPLSELQAAVLRPQWARLPQRNQIRRQAVVHLMDRLKAVGGLRALQNHDQWGQPAYYKLAWLYDPRACGGASRQEFLAAVQAQGVAMDEGFAGFFRRGPRRCRHVGPLTASREAAEYTVLLHHPVLLSGQQAVERVAKAVRQVLESFQRR